jgi:hypothetical protein
MKTTVKLNRVAFGTLTIAALLGVSSAAFAGAVGPDFNFVRLPEPETLALLAIGAVALVISRWKRRK